MGAGVESQGHVLLALSVPPIHSDLGEVTCCDLEEAAH
jgi:hypothetical protein